MYIGAEIQLRAEQEDCAEGNQDPAPQARYRLGPSKSRLGGSGERGNICPPAMLAIVDKARRIPGDAPESPIVRLHHSLPRLPETQG